MLCEQFLYVLGQFLNLWGEEQCNFLDRLPWQPEVKTESFDFLNVWTTFATGDKSNLHQRGNFDTLSKKKIVS